MNDSSLFLTPFLVRDIAEGEQVHLYELEEDFKVYSPSLDAFITVPRGFRFDGESVPLWLMFLVKPFGESRRGACVHDALYRYGGYYTAMGEFKPVTRKQADAVYRELVEAKGLSYWRSTIRWAALRMAGWIAWNENKATHVKV